MRHYMLINSKIINEKITIITDVQILVSGL